MGLTSKAWGMVGAVFCLAGYQLLRHTVGKNAGYVFAAILVLAWVAVAVFNRYRLAKLRQQLSELTPVQRQQALAEIDPEIREDVEHPEKNG